MDLPVTWQDVFKPGSPASQERAEPFSKLSLSPKPGENFAPDTARVLAAHSLLIYSDQGRRSILSKQSLKETFCTDIADTVCSIIEPKEDNSENRHAIVVFRGTANLKNWLTNIHSLPKAWIGGGYVHGGFADAHAKVWAQLSLPMKNLISAERPLFITGHSLGAALATLTLSQILHDHGASTKACAYTFGSPRVGNTDFAHSMNSANLYRIVNNDDIVTRLPLPFSTSRRLSFLHAGEAYFIDRRLQIQSRGKGDIEEESPNIQDITEHVRAIPAAFKESRPPEFLADHAPLRYVDSLSKAQDSLRFRDCQKRAGT